MTKNLLQTILPLKLKTPKNESALVQNEDAYAFFIGHILGDGYFSKKGYMQVDQASESLAKWFHKLLKSYGMLPADSVLGETVRVDKRTNTTTTSYRFCTRTYLLEDWINTFYTKSKRANKKKTVPLNINDLLVEPLSLAIWFLGDGWFDDNAQLCFAAGDWDVEMCKRVQQCLTLNFGFKTTLVTLDPSKNNGRVIHHITLSAESYAKFKQLVKPYLDDLEADMGGAGSLKQDKFLKRKVLP